MLAAEARSKGPPEMINTARDQTSEARNVERVPTVDLHFDRQNPRLFLEEGSDPSESELIRILWRDFAVDEVALSIASNGYFPHETLFAAREEGRLIVVEGNRRLAAVRLLTDEQLREKIGATDLPTIDDDLRRHLDDLPVVKCHRDDVWQYIGFKHVNGPQAWQSYAKAQYIERVHHRLQVPLDVIADTIGDRHWTVKRLYRGLTVLRQAEDSGRFDLRDRWKNHFSFSHIYTSLDYENVRQFLGIDNVSSYCPDPIPKPNLENLEFLFLWLFGRKSTDTQPLVRSQNPHLRLLVATLDDEDGLIALKQGLPLDVAHDIRTGDDKLFKGYLLEARDYLQKSRGKQLTGDTGDMAGLRLAKDIYDLADHLLKDMEAHRRSERFFHRRTDR